MMINTLKIDSSRSKTDLCELGKLHATDKSPYNTNWHRHPDLSGFFKPTSSRNSDSVG